MSATPNNLTKSSFRSHAPEASAAATIAKQQNSQLGKVLLGSTMSFCLLICLIAGSAIAQSSTAPSETVADQTQTKKPAAASTSDDSAVDALFGKTEVTESRRETGQRYRIELEHSAGGKQYIDENDSDGKIESTANDIEDTPNLPKWKLGSW